MPEPRLIDTLRTQANAFNTMNLPNKADFKDKFYKIEKNLEIKGQAYWRNVIDRKIEENAQKILQNEEKFRSISQEETNFVNRIYPSLEEQTQKADVARYDYEKTLEDGFGDENHHMTPKQKADSEIAYKRYIKVKSNYDSWKNKNVDQPRQKYNDKMATITEANDAINDETADYRRYIEEREERERRKSAVNGLYAERSDAIKATYKDIKKAYESHNWLAKIFAHVLPAWMLDASKDLDDLNESKQILLDTGFTEGDIEIFDTEALNEMEEANNAPQQQEVNQNNVLQQEVNQNDEPQQEVNQNNEIIQDRTNQVQNDILVDNNQQNVKNIKNEEENDNLEIKNQLDQPQV